MELEIFICDAFTSQRFRGNPAAVVPVTEWLSDNMMQSIAAENNLSETAFVKQLAMDHYEIRWFSPLCEVDFCGHATLATAHVLFQHFDAGEVIQFDTRLVGPLTVEKDLSGRILMCFPLRKPTPCDAPAELLEGLSIQPVEVLKNPQAYFAIYDNEQDVIDLNTKNDYLKQLAPYDVVATAPSEQFDFVSRYFWPANGGVEDPVTGSIHAGLAPYWAEKLGKDNLMAYQASKRGGTLYCHVEPEQVIVSGDVVPYSHGKIFI
ncbi:PhzF family phenazine biosynthesis protein [Vibrio aquaticus]|uniref:PhzF family phenazine biosynthesis protein n=1 Tax=Vibrio aquaticus TaxID=2496559 RepID=A0A3S0MKM9_9VIBR|nr:PhzF family phenazine biosynthesis protein [Vibrio aquaticus]RTZ17232.1 PhzF family phenazine biosynthesis protein [Vibrio aquaticus]